jgi:gliding motility-associated transport system permease protein
MKGLRAIFERELIGYFITPVAYVFIVIFLAMVGVFTFNIGAFYERSQADLQPFFSFHPWMYLFLIPAVSMRLWSEERRVGTIELLMTLPVSQWAIVAGKFLAAWAFIGIALLLTAPMWITVNWLGSPDNGVILAGYIASFVMAGAFLAIGACVSAITKSQVIAFVLSVVVCFLFLAAGLNAVTDFFANWAPPIVIDTVTSFSFLTHFDTITKGVIDLRDFVFFVTLILFALAANVIIIEQRKAS